MQTIILVLNILTVIGLVAIFLFWREYLPSYAGEKGKNLATKEDVAEITRLVEGAKAESQRDLEGVKAAISSRLGINQFRYEREFEMLVELAQKVIAVRDALASLLAADTQGKTAALRLDCFRALHDLNTYFESREPFINEGVLVPLKILETSFRADAMAEHPAVGLTNDKAVEIITLTKDVIAAIRTRVLEWERFEPGV